VAANGDYTTAQVTESGNLYYTDGRARGALSFVAGSGAYDSSTGVITIPTNNNQITNGAGYITSAALSGYVQGSGSAGQVAYWSTGSAITGESNLFWDATNDRLGIGVTPLYALHIAPNNNLYLSNLFIAGSELNPVLTSGGTGGSISLEGGGLGQGKIYIQGAASGGNGYIEFLIANSQKLLIQSSGAAIFSSSVTASSLIKSGGTSSQYLMADGSVSTLTSPVTGTGTTNTLPKFTGSNTIGNSLFNDNGTNGGFGGTNYSSGTGLRSFNISAQDYPGLVFWANNQTTANIFGLGFTGTLSLEADPSNIFADTKIVMSTDGTERLAIFNNGNVTISNSLTDSGFKLDVNGTGRFSGALSIIGNIDVLAGGVGSSFNTQISLGSGTAYNYQVRANDDDFQLREAGSHVFLAYTYGGSLGTGTIRLYNNTISTASFTGTSFIRSGGTSSQFLKADGSVDSNTYVTGGPFLPLTGGTLTGALNGTSATFTSGVTAGGNIELTNGANRQIIIGSATNYNYRLRTDNDDFVITEAGVTDRLRYSYSTTRWIFSAAATFNSLSGSGNRIVVANSDGTLISAVIGSGLAFDGTTLTATGGASGSISGSGTSGIIPVFTGTSSIGNSVITQSGVNIGINTSTPNVIGFSGPMLTIAGTGQGQGIEIWRNSNSIPNDQDLGLITFLAGTSPKQVARIVGKAVGENEDAGALSFQTSTSAGGVTDRLRITDNGNVGIGDTNPTSSAGWTPKLVLNATSAALVVKGINGQENTFGTSNGCYIDSLGNSFAGNNRILFRTSDLNSSFSASTRMTITSGGNVLIGTTSDNGNRLRVNGTIFSDSSVTATSFFESSDATIKTLVEDAYQAKGIDSVVAKLYIKNGKQELGYYAQDLEGVLPSAVSKGSNGLLNLSYREVHTAKIAYLEQQIKELRNELLKPS
jgi:hypothetical protein